MPRNGDGLYRRKGNPVWKFKYKDQATGEWIEESTGTRNHNEARRVRQDWIERSQKGQLPTDFADYQLADALDEHQTYVEATASKSSLAPYRTSSRHLRRILGERKLLKAITSEDVRRYQIARRRDGAASKTINNEMLTLTALLKRARVWVTIEPDYKPLKVPKRGPGVALTPEEGQHLFAVANLKPAWFVALRAGLLAYSTGCRTNEIRRLQLCDLTLDRTPPRIRVRREVTKSDAGVREVVLNELGIWSASALLERAKLLGAFAPTHYLLPANCSRHTRASDPLYGQRGFDPERSQVSWQSAWESLRKAAGFPQLRFHDLRHTFITQAVEAGVPIEVVMAQVGHLSAEMTRYYTHLGTRARERVAAASAQANPGLISVLTPRPQSFPA